MERTYNRRELAAHCGLTFEQLKTRLKAGGLGPGVSNWHAMTFTQREADDARDWTRGDVVRLRVISLGAGVQSTAMVLMALRGMFDPAPDCAIFSDMGFEPRHVYENMQRLQTAADAAGFPVHTITTHSLFHDLLGAAEAGKPIPTAPFYVKKDDGTAGQLQRQCTARYKIEPVMQKMRELLDVRKGQPCRYVVENWLGITTDETYRVNYNTRVPWLRNVYPLIDRGMSRQDCIDWMAGIGYPVPGRSACLACPYRSLSELAEIKRQGGEDWQRLVQIDEAVRGGMGILHRSAKGELYVHQSLRPVAELPLDAAPAEQRGLWGEECSGMCAT